MGDDFQDGSEEDPDHIAGLQPDPNDLGAAGRRNPDYMPPSNTFEVIASAVYQAVAACGGGNVTFGIKAGVLSGELSTILPLITT